MWPTDVVVPSRPSATARIGDVAVGEDADEAFRELIGIDDGDDADVLVFHEACGVDERRFRSHARRVFRHDVLRFHLIPPVSVVKGQGPSQGNGQGLRGRTVLRAAGCALVLLSDGQTQQSQSPTSSPRTRPSSALSHPHRSPVRDLTGATKKDILALARENNVRFLRLQFTDILGVNKNVELPASQFEKALDGDIMFDGSSIEGFVRIEESDMLLAPDLSTFQLFPWGDSESRVARLICDINTPDGRPFDGDPRAALKRQIARAAALGYTMNAGMEAEFFMFKPGADGEAATVTNDVGGYFDLAPADLGEDARRAMVDMLERMGFEVEAAHHEVAHGQHEIDFRYADALKTADNIATFRFVVKHVARQFGLVASFMPKPIFGQNGSGMHTHQSLFRGDENAFWDAKAEWQLSPVALSLHRRIVAACARDVRGDESAGELVQAAGAGLRGAGERRVVDAQSVAADPRAGSPRVGDASRAADA